MTTAERWIFHADVYAFRRVYQDVPEAERTSPCDPTGEWFDEQLVRAATLRKREKRDGPRLARERVRDRNSIEGLDICSRWAQERGFPDFAAAEHAGHTHADVIRSFTGPREMPGDARGRWRGTAADLGVTAVEKTWTPEEMAAGRRELGLETPA